ncbi:uracil-DNA glycosylase [Candidatus Peregrinibacteria bacterium]|nr:uracil-DNA glycosylase [Candidatus Peregrinibacteria bacterium]
MDVRMEQTWKDRLADEFDKEYFHFLAEFVRSAYRNEVVYPPPKCIFRAFEMCPFDQVKVVILGQDPYHGPKQAHGLCFSVNEGIALPPSLVNIFREIEDDCKVSVSKTGDLSRWARQGVLLLNATLTVTQGRAGSHQHKGWEDFTDRVVDLLSREREHLVFLLWGRYAQEKGARIDMTRHLVLKAAHPSPLSAHSGFFGCRHFRSANEYLAAHGKQGIDWR